ncbi:hypothetical protein [Sphingomonas sp. CFBP 13706]|nr:hypothetical protein [Sphingomonas sp. CFBP 13706]MBD8735779.1 hypothetical protein [Sphingomonas sp. CFBP 13706]
MAKFEITRAARRGNLLKGGASLLTLCLAAAPNGALAQQADAAAGQTTLT